MRRTQISILAVVLALGALAAPALARRPAARVRPRAFASCARLVGYERAHFAVTHGVPEISPRPLSQPSIGGPLSSAPSPQAPNAAPQENGGTNGSGTSFSTTNNQEPGVDEPDLVKTDGSTIFAVEQGTLYAVATTGPSPRLAGSLPLGNSGYGAQLLLRGSRLIVISGSSAVPVGVGVAAPAIPAGASSIAPSPYFYPATTTLTEVDVHDPAAMTVARTMNLEGTFVDARQNGPTARLVISSAPRALASPGMRARASGWVPARRFHSLITGHRYSRPIAACSDVRQPVQFSGLGMLSILTINLDRGLYATDSTALAADAQVVYGSQSGLYVATQRWIDPRTPATRVPSSPETVIDQFDARNPDSTTLLAAGAVPGYLLNQFSLSEYNGYLRVASTSRPIWWDGAQPPPSQSFVTVLADRSGALVPVGQVSGLGPGQEIYSVRFIGDSGYVVTFRRVDPLYTIDLSSPTAPRVAGQLELSGYSAYLHPLADGLLLGIGQEVGPGNEPSGTQLELFDVSDPSAPRLLSRAALGSGSSSQVQYDPHAFLFWPPTALAVLPVTIYSQAPVTVPPSPQPLPPIAPGGGPQASTPTPAGEFSGAIGFHVDRSGIAEVGRISHDPVNGASPPVDRSLVIGQQLFTVSSEGVMASSIATLAREAFVAFPSPVPRGGGSSATTAAQAAASTAPAATTGGASSVSFSAAILLGSVNPRGQATNFVFQYGPTRAYGFQTPLSAAGNGRRSTRVSQSIAGLQALSTYHYRIVASSAAGTATGSDRTFTTPKIPLSVAIAGVPNPVTFGNPLVVEGTLSGTGAANQQIMLQANPYPYVRGFRIVGNPEVTDSAGAFSFPFLGLLESAQLRVVTVGRPQVSSPVVLESVAVRVSFHARPARRRGFMRLYGTVTPAEVGALVGFQLLKPGHRSVNEGGTSLKAGSATVSTFSRVVRVPRPGVYRALIQVTAGPHVSSYSAPILIR